MKGAPAKRLSETEPGATAGRSAARSTSQKTAAPAHRAMAGIASRHRIAPRRTR